MNMDPLLPFVTILGGMALVMALAWLFQRIVRNGGWVDAFWSFGSGLACVTAALWPGPVASAERQILVAVLAAVWSIRLGLYVVHRVATTHEDRRYSDLRKEWGPRFQANMFLLVIVQAPATAVLCLSVLFAAHGGAGQLGVRDLLGALMLVLAIGGEALADEQMRRFKKTAAKGAVMDKGLWSWSRHPNYFFEWLGWLAYPVIGFDPADAWSWATWIAPVVMFVILRFGTGVPALEKAMLQSRGDAWRSYQARVSAFFPLPPKGKSS